MPNAVFVLDHEQRPLRPVHPAVARRMLTMKQAAVFRRYPFTIICRGGISTGTAPPLRLKIDPGSKTTGLAILDGHCVIWIAELTHRGSRIQAALEARRAIRRNRRQRHVRYRQPRFLNRTHPAGWLPPSLESRVANVMIWVQRLARYARIAAISQELVRFDTQLMQSPEITGVEYQHGELAGYEVREYVLEKWHRTCAYCGVEGVRLEVEHIVPKIRGGSDRAGNLTLACVPCNQKKGSQTAAEFGYPLVQTQAKQPLKDAAAVNSTRWALYHALQTTGLPVEVGTGGRTKYNRTRLGIPKSHWGDAACVGASTSDTLVLLTTHPLQITAMGRGTRQMCGTDKYGFPHRHRGRSTTFLGFATGDIVTARIPTGKYTGVHTGRITIRQRANFRLNGFDVRPKYLTIIAKKDGYAYGSHQH